MLLQLKKSLRFDDAAEAKKNKMLLNSVRNIITIIWQTKTLAFLKLKAGNKKKIKQNIIYQGASTTKLWVIST